MRTFRFLAAMVCAAAALAACASDSPVKAQYVPVVASDGAEISRLSRDVKVAFHDGSAYTLPEGSQWRRVGALVQGDVYRPLGEPLRVNGGEAYLVASSRSLVGFYLPAGSLFKPLRKPVLLPFSQR